MQIDFIICSDSKVLWNVFISLRVEQRECSLRGTQVCTILHAPFFLLEQMYNIFNKVYVYVCAHLFVQCVLSCLDITL